MKNKVVIITGGTSGIGKALAFEFGLKGALIAISGRNQQNLNDTIAELQQKGIQAIGINADVSIECF